MLTVVLQGANAELFNVPTSNVKEIPHPCAVPAWMAEEASFASPLCHPRLSLEEIDPDDSFGSLCSSPSAAAHGEDLEGSFSSLDLPLPSRGGPPSDKTMSSHGTSTLPPSDTAKSSSGWTRV